MCHHHGGSTYHAKCLAVEHERIVKLAVLFVLDGATVNTKCRTQAGGGSGRRIQVDGRWHSSGIASAGECGGDTSKDLAGWAQLGPKHDGNLGLLGRS